MARSRGARDPRVLVGNIASRHAHGWRMNTSCAAIAYLRMAVRQSSSSGGSSISPTTTSTIASTSSALLGTW